MSGVTRFRLWSPPGRQLGASDVFVSFLCLYLITAARTVPYGDAVPMWEAAAAFARDGSIAIPSRWPVNAPAGPSGHFYPVAALLTWLVHVPGALLQRLLLSWAPGREGEFVAITAQLAPLALGAATPALLFRTATQLGYARRQAAWCALLLGAATPIWVYAHRPYAESLQAACFVLFFGQLVRVAERPDRAAALRFGLTAALLINAKNVYFVCLPGAVAYLLWRLRARPGAWRAVTGWALVGFAPGLLALAAYNHARWGSVFSSGYEGVTRGFWNENVAVGLWGQLLSPGKSIFLYAPPLLLSLVGARRFWATRRHVAVAALLVVAPVVLVYARYLFWSGDWGWGPRYLVFALPVLLLPAAETFAPVSPGGNWWRRAGALAVALVLAAGVAVQVLGTAFSWDDFINISRRAQRQWLGRPDMRGTVLHPFPCPSCFEEVYAIEWLPPMQPIAGHWWLLRHKVRGDGAAVAAADAPWARYTSLPIDIADMYDAALIDWWPMGTPRERRPAALLIALCMLLAIPARPWRRALQPSAAPDASPP